MRWFPVAPPPAATAAVAALLLLSLSGCTGEEEAPEDPLIHVCPQWIAGPDVVAGNATAGPDGVEVVLEPTRNGSLVDDLDGFPLDLFVLELTSGGPAHARAATTDGRDLLLRDAEAAEPDSRPSLTVDGEALWSVYLTAVSRTAEPDPSGVTLRLTADAPTEVAVKATPWYRVCGAVVDAPGRP